MLFRNAERLLHSTVLLQILLFLSKVKVLFTTTERCVVAFCVFLGNLFVLETWEMIELTVDLNVISSIACLVGLDVWLVEQKGEKD